jgi:hypothetical protein
MDRSFLSDKALIRASRDFVCVRLATYESKEEAELLKSLFIGRSGELENTTFALLSPDGLRRLCRTGRSPSFAFSTPAEMATEMRTITESYRPRDRVGAKNNVLPSLKNVRLGLNVASCDGQLLVVTYGATKKSLSRLESKLGKLAWAKPHIGRFAYASSRRAEELAKVEGFKSAEGYVIVAPGTFGVDGRVVAQLPAKASAEELATALEKSYARHSAEPKSTRDHISKGRRSGVHWDTEIPVTDPGGRGRRP